MDIAKDNPSEEKAGVRGMCDVSRRQCLATEPHAYAVCIRTTYRFLLARTVLRLGEFAPRARAVQPHSPTLSTIAAAEPIHDWPPPPTPRLHPHSVPITPVRAAAAAPLPVTSSSALQACPAGASSSWVPLPPHSPGPQSQQLLDLRRAVHPCCMPPPLPF